MESGCTGRWGPCLDERLLRAYVDNRGPDGSRKAVERHIADCGECRQWVIAVWEYSVSTLAELPAKIDPARVDPGARLGRYQLRGLLGAGGMGLIHRAYDPELEREIAIKVVAHETERARTDLLHEARIAARVRHPNVISIYDVGQVASEVFVAMELIDGGTTLSTWLSRSGESCWRAIVEKFVEAGRGLQAVHDAGITHCDFKPHNVLIGSDGRVCLCDFGLARAAAKPAARATRGESWEIVGTPAYMAPEQYRGQPVDARADQYAFSVALYEAVAGIHPFRGSTIPAKRHDRSRRLPAPVREGVPDRLMGILQRALAVDPGDRWDSMEVMLAQLTSVAQDRPASRGHPVRLPRPSDSAAAA
jgi:serine/threonine protein kinase